MNKFEFIEEGHKYLLNGKRLTGVTTIIGIIAKPELIAWSAKQAGEFIQKQAVYNRKENNYTILKKDIELSKTAWCGTRDRAGDVGTILHSIVEDYVKSKINKTEFNFEISKQYAIQKYKIEITEKELIKVKPMFDQFLNWEKEDNIQFLLSEQKIYSEKYWYAGTVDLVFIKDGKVYIGDLKTSRDVYYSHFTQMGGYEVGLKERGKILQCEGYCVINIPKYLNKEGLAIKRVIYEGNNQEHMKAFLNACYLYRYKSKHEKRFGTTRAKKKTGITSKKSVTIKI